ncbi:MAG: class IV adenylate cyclase [Chloroflexota bacterium]|nr:class IV adenylate cyclase [Chloroflexota bacterium]
MVEPAPARNLELKVGCDPATLAHVRERLAAGGVSFVTLTQVDTYFAVPSGRLKLRQSAPAIGNEQTAELIGYVRPDTSGPRWSAYHRVPVAAVNATMLKAALTATVGVLTEVIKTRTVGLRGRTRVHLDEVQGLGAFVELETVVVGEDDGSADAELAETAALLGLDRLVPIPGSYSDLLLATRNRLQSMVTSTDVDRPLLPGGG